jgi:hypothetical protein
MIFLSNFRIEIFFVKNTPFSSLKSVRAENEEEELGTCTTEQSLGRLIITGI